MKKRTLIVSILVVIVLVVAAIPLLSDGGFEERNSSSIIWTSLVGEGIIAPACGSTEASVTCSGGDPVVTIATDYPGHGGSCTGVNVDISGSGVPGGSVNSGTMSCGTSWTYSNGLIDDTVYNYTVNFQTLIGGGQTCVQHKGGMSCTDNPPIPSGDSYSGTFTTPMCTPAPTATLSAIPSSITTGGSSTLTWGSTNADSCTSTSFGPVNGATAGSVSVNPGSTKSYTITCSNSAGSASDSATVTVSNPPSSASVSSSDESITIGESTTLLWSCSNDTDSSAGVNFSTGGALSGSTAVSPVSDTTYTVACSNDDGSVQDSTTITVLNPTLSISASPAKVRPGNSTTISWSATGEPDNCAVSGPSFSASGTSGSQGTGSINEQSTYTLVCLYDAVTLSDQVTVTLIPSFEEF